MHRRPYRDTSLLIELFVAQKGIVSVVARGARNRSRRGSVGTLLQPFSPLLVSFTGRSDLKTLTATESAAPPYGLAGERLYSGMYLNELLVRLMHRHDPHPRLFAAYGDALQQLALPLPAAPTLRAFELLLLDELGYSFSLTHEAVSGARVEADARYRYEPGHGLYPALQAEGGYSGRDLLAMAVGEFGGAVAPHAKRLLREALAEHLGSEPLRSRELFLGGARGSRPGGDAMMRHRSPAAASDDRDGSPGGSE